MVRAILAGRKTQTRRIVKPQPHGGVRHSPFVPSGLEDGHGHELRPPYGQPEDRLWVRETWALSGWAADQKPAEYQHPEAALRNNLLFRADADGYDDCMQHWRPSIHMPRWASRITLEITGVRVERLQDICEADALAEGIERPEDIRNIDVWDGAERALFNGLNQPVTQFRRLWESINGPGAWGANPWVWVVEFRRAQP